MEVISGIIATVDGGAILAFAGWLIRRHFHRDEASQQTGPSETAQTRPVQHLQDRQSDNAHAGAHAGANSLPQTMSQKDHADYRQLLQLYESNLNLLEDLIITRSQLEAGPDEWNLVLDQQFARTRDGIYQNLEQPMGIFNKLDILEGRAARKARRNLLLNLGPANHPREPVLRCGHFKAYRKVGAPVRTPTLYPVGQNSTPSGKGPLPGTLPRRAKNLSPITLPLLD